MSKFNVNQSLGDIVATMPRASEVFKRLKIDFCCGGHRPLAEAIREQGLNENEVLNELNELSSTVANESNKIDFREMTSSNLIDYIIDTHHTFVVKTLPEISELSSKILRVHGAGHRELFRVHKLYHDLKTELEQHLIKEEEMLFPMIKKYENNPSEEILEDIQSVMKETEDEHDVAGDVLSELRQITNNYEMPKDGCTTYWLTYKKIQELENDLFEHIHLENNILFKRFEI